MSFFDVETGQTVYLEMASDLRETIRLRQKALEVEKLTSMGRLAAGTAHTLNTPLAAMLLRIEMLKDHCDDRGEKCGLVAKGQQAGRCEGQHAVCAKSHSKVFLSTRTHVSIARKSCNGRDNFLHYVRETNDFRNASSPAPIPPLPSIQFGPRVAMGQKAPSWGDIRRGRVVGGNIEKKRGVLIEPGKDTRNRVNGLL